MPDYVTIVSGSLRDVLFTEAAFCDKDSFEKNCHGKIIFVPALGIRYRGFRRSRLASCGRIRCPLLLAKDPTPGRFRREKAICLVTPDDAGTCTRG